MRPNSQYRALISALRSSSITGAGKTRQLVAILPPLLSLCRDQQSGAAVVAAQCIAELAARFPDDAAPLLTSDASLDCFGRPFP